MIGKEVVAVAVVVAAVMTTGSTAGAATWQPAEGVDVVRGLPNPDVAINSGGNATVVYSSSSRLGGPATRRAVRAPGRAFETLAAIAGRALDPRIAMAPDGATAIAAAGRGRVGVRIYRAPGPGGRAGATPTDGSAFGLDADGLAVGDIGVGIDATGKATVTWASPTGWDLSGAVNQIYAASVVRGRGVVSVQKLGEPAPCTPSIDVNLAGDAVVSRDCRLRHGDFFFRPAGGSFGPAEAPFAGDGSVRMSIAGDGTVHAYEVVDRGGKGGAEQRLLYAVRPPSGPFGTPEPLDFAVHAAASFTLQAQEDGDVIAAWDSGYALREPGHPFGPVRELAASRPFGLVSSPTGPALAYWTERVDGYGEDARQRVFAAVIDGDTPPAPEPVGPPGVLEGGAPSFAINDEGAAVGAWEQRCAPDSALMVVAVARDRRGDRVSTPCAGRPAPRARIRGRRAVLRGRALRVAVGCDRACRLTARGRLLARGRRPVRGRLFGRTRLDGAGRRHVGLRVSRRRARRLRRALRGRARISLRLRLIARDRFGNRRVVWRVLPVRSQLSARSAEVVTRRRG